MNRTFRHLLIATLLAGTAGAGLQARSAAFDRREPHTMNAVTAADRLRKCRVPGLDEEVLCGQLEVYENRALRSGRKIPLNIVVLPATGSPIEPDPMAYLAGGGVLPATRYAARFARLFPALRQHRDILLVDQRGTGGSNRLACSIAPDALPAHRRPEAYANEIRKCRTELEARADLRLYTTPIAMEDLDEVRAWLGYPQLNLYGVSYGTKAAQVYLRQHPDRVRSILLHGPMPVDVAMWPDLGVNAGAMFDRVIALCAVDAGCRAAFPDVKREADAVLRRLHEASVSVEVETPDGRTKPFVVDETQMRTFMGGGSVSRLAMSHLPLFIHAAAGGNFKPVAQVMSEEAPSDLAPPRGLFLSILCAETIPLVDAAQYRQKAAASIYGQWSADMPLLECAQWPQAPMPADFWKPVTSSVPTLIMVGDLDAVTPVAYAERLVPRFSKGRMLTLPFRSHNDLDACVAGLGQAFIAAGTADRLDTSCVAASPRLEFRTSLDRSPR